MKAVWVSQFAPIDTIGVANVPSPSPGQGEVIINVVAAEVNYPDILVIEGRYQIKPPLPFAPGKCASGRIAQVGPGVTTIRPGDRVVAQTEYGAYAEQLKVRAEGCFLMPDTLPFDKGAALGLVYQTAWFALRERAQFSPGESVLVLGASGGIGVASVQLAKAFGARVVIAGVAGQESEETARAAGADHVLNLSRPGLRDWLREAVSSATQGRGVDVVIDPVGGEPNAAALRALAWCGRLVVVGFASGEIPTIKANYLLVKNISVSGIQWSDYRERTPERVIEAQKQIFSLYVAGKIDPIISHHVPLEQFAEALALLRDGHAKGKVILQVQPN